ncbi:cytochrome c oxidase subunit II [Tengunoibacter tsumagoiensis]|nr:cytochrome c oxidase subunit II [Tengunoibacter tsumagoiensis]
MPVFRRTNRWLLLLSSLLLSSILLSACGEQSPSIIDARGFVAQQEGFVFWVILVIAAVVFVGVEGMLVYSIFRFRERPDSVNPRQNHGSLALEILWTAIPTFFLLVILVFTIRGLFQVAPDAQPADSKTVNVTAIGHQWWWEFHYQQYNITTADTLVIPAGTVVHVDLFSNNVIHSFWVPQLTGKTDLVPGHDNKKWFKADDDTVGKTFVGICAEFCGAQHGNMRFEVKVESADGFQSWLTAQSQHAATPASGSLAEEGQKIFQGAGACAGCHGIVGVNAQQFIDTAKVCDDSNPKDLNNNECPLGPNLTHFGSRGLIAGGVLDNNSSQCNTDQSASDLLANCNLAKWLHDPQGVKPGNDMAIGQLTNDQIKALVAYLESLK